MALCLSVALGLVALFAAGARAQVSLSGMVDVAHKRDIRQKAGERDAQINKALKGGSPFSLVRTRFFVDGEVREDISVFTTVLYDEGVGLLELEGAYISFKGVRQYEALSVQVGKMATVFGSFAPRSFGVVNPLIGLPLIYHYFSAVQGASVPRDNADHFARRDAITSFRRGLPMIYDACWNTGVELTGSLEHFTYAAALTKGTLSNPSANGSEGLQFVGRLGVQPSMGSKMAISLALRSVPEQISGKQRRFPVRQVLEGLQSIHLRDRCRVQSGSFHIFWRSGQEPLGGAKPEGGEPRQHRGAHRSYVCHFSRI